MRDLKPLLALVVVSGLLLFIVPWWVALGAFIGGYIALGKITFMHVIADIQEVTGLDYFRAVAIYEASLNGDWSKISTADLQVKKTPHSRKKGERVRTKRQVATLILMEKSRREVTDDLEPFPQNDEVTHDGFDSAFAKRGKSTFVLWIIARSLVYAALQTNVVWAIAGERVDWISVWCWLSALHYLINFPKIWNAKKFQFMATLDIGLAFMSLWSGIIIGSILAGIVGGIMWLTRSWTGVEADWFPLWIGIVSGAVLIWREWYKHKGHKAWMGVK